MFGSIYFSSVKLATHVSDYDNFDRAQEEVGFSEETVYINFTGRRVVVCNRLGIRTVVKPCELPPMGRDKFVVRKIIKYNNLHKDYIANGILSTKDKVSINNAIYNQLFSATHSLGAGASYNTAGYKAIVLDYEIPTNILKERGVLYYNEADIVLGIGNEQTLLTSMVHPFSEEGKLLKYADTLPLDHETSAYQIALELVDNQGKFSQMFFRYGTQVSELISVADPVREDGVYVKDNQGMDITFIPLTEGITDDIKLQLLNFGIYSTYSEASELGEELLNKADQRKRLELEAKLKEMKLEHEKELQEMKMEQAKLAAELEEKKSKLERKKDKLAKKLARFNLKKDKESRREKDYYESRKVRRNDYYEDRSYERKDSSEWMKSLPMILTGLGGIFLAMRAFA